MKRDRKSPQSKKETYDEAAEPLHRHAKSDADGNVSFVTDRKRYPVAGEPISDNIAAFALIPNPIDQNPWAHWRSPMDMMRQGWSTSLFHAAQQWSTRSS